ncbi:MAG: Fe(3+) ABC transporter substrate-binding protein [Bacteroidota bacterium]
MKNTYLFLFLLFGLWSCGGGSSDSQSGDGAGNTNADQEVTVYTHRHYDTDQQLFDEFEKESGIKVKVVNASADELIQKMIAEGEQSPADVLITVDAGRLVRAKSKGLLQSIESATLDQNIPAHLRDGEKQWFGLTKRARIIAYHPDRVQAEELSTYEALTEDRWKGKVLIRSSGNIYNQSLMASLIANLGEEKAKSWAEGIVANLARAPKGNDRDQVKAIVAGEGDVAIVNTYYIGKLLNSKDSTEVEAGQSIRLFFPNGEDRGSHINVSGIGVAKNAPHRDNAVKLIEFLSGVKAQEIFAKSNYEYPVNPSAQASELLQSWGAFKEDTLPLSKLGELNQQAVILFDQVGWK